MKKTTFIYGLIAAILCLSATHSHAQFQVGIRGGINVANFNPGVIFDYDNRVGANVAFLFNKSLTSNLSIQFEPGFSQRGAKYEYTVDGPSNWNITTTKEKGKFMINFIELPVLVQWKPQLGKFTGMVSLGPEIRYRVGDARQKYTAKITYANGSMEERSSTVDLKEGFGSRTFDYGLAGGVGLSYPLRSVSIFAEGRYHLGLRQLVRSLDMYHRGPSFHLGVLVPLKK